MTVDEYQLRYPNRLKISDLTFHVLQETDSLPSIRHQYEQTRQQNEILV